MRKIAILLVSLFVSGASFAQNSAVGKASSLLQKNDLAGAKEQIDAAIVHEKTADKPKTWFVKGEVYEAISKAENADALAPNALAEAVAAYNKAKELEGKETATYYVFADQRIEGIWGGFLNEGATAYQESDFGKAAELFGKAADIKPQDTTSLMYAGIAAQQNEDHKLALTYYYRLLGANYKSVDIYSSIIYLERAKNEDNDKALEVVQMAKRDFPENKDFPKEEINILIVTGKSDEAKKALEDAIAAEPSNANLYYNYAILSDELKDNAAARANYKKALEFNPEYFDAAFNLAVNYYNEAADILKEANNMDIKTYQKKGKQVEDKAMAIFKESLPYWEQAHKINPSDLTTVETLQVIYTRLKMMDKAEEMMNKAEALNAGN